MKIKLSQLRKIIREEITRSTVNEGVFTLYTPTTDEMKQRPTALLSDLCKEVNEKLANHVTQFLKSEGMLQFFTVYSGNDRPRNERSGKADRVRDTTAFSSRQVSETSIGFSMQKIRDEYLKYKQEGKSGENEIFDFITKNKPMPSELEAMLKQEYIPSVIESIIPVLTKMGFTPSTTESSGLSRAGRVYDALVAPKQGMPDDAQQYKIIVTLQGNEDGQEYIYQFSVFYVRRDSKAQDRDASVRRKQWRDAKGNYGNS